MTRLTDFDVIAPPGSLTPTPARPVIVNLPEGISARPSTPVTNSLQEENQVPENYIAQHQSAVRQQRSIHPTASTPMLERVERLNQEDRLQRSWTTLLARETWVARRWADIQAYEARLSNHNNALELRAHEINTEYARLNQERASLHYHQVQLHAQQQAVTREADSARQDAARNVRTSQTLTRWERRLQNADRLGPHIADMVAPNVDFQGSVSGVRQASPESTLPADLTCAIC